jgi:hypothetical protein
MATEFEINGPFRIPLIGPTKARHPDVPTAWWEESEEKWRLADAHGCYIFFRRIGRADLPIYVGKTQAQKGFRSECFTKRNLWLLMKGMHDRTGTLNLVLVERLHARGRPALDAIIDLERYLISAAAVRNPIGLMNTRGTRDSGPRWSIRGVTTVSPGYPSARVREFKEMLGIASAPRLATRP